MHAEGYHTGKVGAEVSWEQAYEHAKLTCLNLLGAIEDAVGSLTKVTKVVKVLGMVNATPDFMAHPMIINGASDLLVAVSAQKSGCTPGRRSESVPCPVRSRSSWR